MSAPVMVACAVVVLGVGLPALSLTAEVEAQQRAAATADAAALAAADALNGWLDLEPCEAAETVVTAGGARMTRCEPDFVTGRARVGVGVRAPLGVRNAEARAGPANIAGAFGGGAEDAERGPRGANGWAWPAQRGGLTQGFHDGYSIDLAAEQGSPLYAPYAGIVVAASSDGGGIPEVCRTTPEWWRGTNHRVVIRHVYAGRVMFSSHNHVSPGSPARHGLAPGSRVRAGQVVAEAGMSGCTSGPHTHFTLATTPSNAFPDLNPFHYLQYPGAS